MDTLLNFEAILTSRIWEPNCFSENIFKLSLMHAVKACVSKDIAVLVLNIGARWRGAISFTFRPHYFKGKRRRYSSSRKMFTCQTNKMYCDIFYKLQELYKKTMTLQSLNFGTNGIYVIVKKRRGSVSLQFHRGIWSSSKL
jgi:hypothetical protein